MEQLPVDFLSAAAHKFHGPKGVGFSFVRKIQDFSLLFTEELKSEDCVLELNLFTI